MFQVFLLLAVVGYLDKVQQSNSSFFCREMIHVLKSRVADIFKLHIPTTSGGGKPFA
jgi:hypothetical protein